MNKTDYISYRTHEKECEKRADRRAVLLAASALFIFGAFLGCAIYRLLGLGESELYDNLIERYFVALFYKCADSMDVLSVVLDCFMHELWGLIIVFIGGFTLFTTVVSGGVLLYRGILFGFAVTMLQFSSKSGLLLDSICYLAASFAVSMLTVIMAALAFGYFYPKRSPMLKSHETRDYSLAFLKLAALVFANICFMLFMIYIYL
ncbi:MAG: hypothetical protein HFE63_05685 [Clostridiales bacterium]|nr:hypothetical protein [Clostridiales bacterium]